MNILCCTSSMMRSCMICKAPAKITPMVTTTTRTIQELEIWAPWIKLMIACIPRGRDKATIPEKIA